MDGSPPESQSQQFPLGYGFPGEDIRPPHEVQYSELLEAGSALRQ
jgi:hypothetical protein